MNISVPIVVCVALCHAFIHCCLVSLECATDNYYASATQVSAWLYTCTCNFCGMPPLNACLNSLMMPWYRYSYKLDITLEPTLTAGHWTTHVYTTSPYMFTLYSFLEYLCGGCAAWVSHNIWTIMTSCRHTTDRVKLNTNQFLLFLLLLLELPSVFLPLPC